MFMLACLEQILILLIYKVHIVITSETINSSDIGLTVTTRSTPSYISRVRYGVCVWGGGGGGGGSMPWGCSRASLPFHSRAEAPVSGEFATHNYGDEDLLGPLIPKREYKLRVCKCTGFYYASQLDSLLGHHESGTV